MRAAPSIPESPPRARITRKASERAEADLWDSHFVISRGSVASMPTLDAAGLERLARDIFAALGVPADDAAWIATLLVRANLRGHDSHGVIRVPSYVKALEAGEVNPRPTITVESDTPTI